MLQGILCGNCYSFSPLIPLQMRYTKKVSMWPVGLVTKTGVSSPIIRNGKLDGYYDGWIGGRKYPVDMAGFAVSVKFLHERPKAKMPFKPGYEEDGFLRSLAPLDNNEIELLANECREVVHATSYMICLYNIFVSLYRYSRGTRRRRRIRPRSRLTRHDMATRIWPSLRRCWYDRRTTGLLVWPAYS